MIRFFVPGIPKPAGSKRGIPIYRGKKCAKVFTGKVAVIDACKTSNDWKGDVKNIAANEYQGALIEGPVSVSFRFFFTRPKSHYGSGINSAILKASAPVHHTHKPDALKLSRAVEDALTGIVWVDDSQIVDEKLTKQYGDKPGVEILIEPLLNTNPLGV